MPKRTTPAALRSGLLGPVDISSLAYFRIVFGSMMLWEVWRYFEHGWIRRYYIEPQLLFKYHGFGWVERLPGDWMFVHFAGLGALAACILVGLWYRTAAALFCVGFTYVFLVAQSRYLNHFYLICLVSFLLVFVPAAGSFSLDARRNPATRRDTAPGWALWLLRSQLGIVYFYGGVAKLNGDWLRGEPMRSWLLARTDVPLIGPLFTFESTVHVFAIGGLLLDLLIVPLLLWRPTRVAACLALVIFHLLNARLFKIGIFPWFMLLATPIFLPPDLPRRVAASVRAAWRGERARARLELRPWPGAVTVPDEQTDDMRSDGRVAPAARVPDRRVAPAAALRSDGRVAPPAASRRSDRLTLALVAGYLAVQLLVPLRHHLYPGNVAWTEEGHRFSWRMKLRDKDAEAAFIVLDRRSGKTWVVDPLEHLTPRQLDEMASRPGMILQFSHFLEERKRQEGYDDVDVRALVSASLNGRDPQLLVDPTVDLTEERRTLTPADWILPLMAAPAGPPPD